MVQNLTPRRKRTRSDTTNGISPAGAVEASTQKRRRCTTTAATVAVHQEGKGRNDNDSSVVLATAAVMNQDKTPKRPLPLEQEIIVIDDSDDDSHDDDGDSDIGCPDSTSSLLSPIPTKRSPPPVPSTNLRECTPEKDLFSLLHHDNNDNNNAVADASTTGRTTTTTTTTATSLSDTKPSSSTNTSTTTKQQPFPFVSSAYVQNLAEICHTILYDERWQTEKEKNRTVDGTNCSGSSAGPSLFAWQYGNDMIAVQAFAKLYQNNDTSATEGKVTNDKRRNDVCSCLCCQQEKVGPSESDPSSISTTTTHLNDNDSTVSNDNCDTTAATPLNNPSSNTDRALHLYSRLYYRKGPWFRLDDVFRRYYAPKQDDGKGNDTSDCRFQRSIRAMQELLHDLHRLVQLGLLRTFDSEEECGKVAGLPSLGLLNAEERQVVLKKLGGNCRTSTGRKRRSVSSSHRNNNSSTTTTPTTPTPRSTTKLPSLLRMSTPQENLVWKQMTQQTSIAAFFSKPKTTHNAESNERNRPGSVAPKQQYRQQPQSILPVRAHVAEQILTKALLQVVLSSVETTGETESYIPAHILKPEMMVVRQAILDFEQERQRQEQKWNNNNNGSSDDSSDGKSIRNTSNTTTTNNNNATTPTRNHRHHKSTHHDDKTVDSILTSFCLTSSPLQTLLRVCRLYLCATGGPGDMRSDSTNGWKSLRRHNACFVSHIMSTPISNG